MRCGRCILTERPCSRTGKALCATRFLKPSMPCTSSAVRTSASVRVERERLKSCVWNVRSSESAATVLRRFGWRGRRSLPPTFAPFWKPVKRRVQYASSVIGTFYPERSSADRSSDGRWAFPRQIFRLPRAF